MKGWTEGPKFVLANSFHHPLKLWNTKVKESRLLVQQPEP